MSTEHQSTRAHNPRIQAREDLSRAREAHADQDRFGAAIHLGFALIESVMALADAVRSIDQTQKRKS